MFGHCSGPYPGNQNKDCPTYVYVKKMEDFCPKEQGGSIVTDKDSSDIDPCVEINSKCGMIEDSVIPARQ